MREINLKKRQTADKSLTLKAFYSTLPAKVPIEDAQAYVNYLESYGFKQSEEDPCDYEYTDKNGEIWTISAGVTSIIFK